MESSSHHQRERERERQTERESSSASNKESKGVANLITTDFKDLCLSSSEKFISKLRDVQGADHSTALHSLLS